MPFLVCHSFPLADVATQARFAEDLAFILKPVPGSATAGDWGPVYGELLTFGEVKKQPPNLTAGEFNRSE